ncbi:hypothetical protein AFCA_013358 [Aspergillus flavus]|nr:hypothetical protein AFCA_013358 [Aspergillus flavus]
MALVAFKKGLLLNMHIIRRLYLTPRCRQIKSTSSNSSASITTSIHRYASSKDRTTQNGESNSNDLVEDKVIEKDVKYQGSLSKNPSHQTSAEPKSTEGQQKYYSLKNYREGPNTESGELGSKRDEEGVKAHNKDMKDRHDRY